MIIRGETGWAYKNNEDSAWFYAPCEPEICWKKCQINIDEFLTALDTRSDYVMPDNEEFRKGHSVGYAHAYGDVSDLKASLGERKRAIDILTAQNEWLKDRLSDLQLSSRDPRNIEAWLVECGMPAGNLEVEDGMEPADLNGWQPIDSAPQDGTKIDLWVRIRPSKMDEPESFERFPGAWWDADRHDWKLGRLNWHAKFYADAHIPVLWMPVSTPAARTAA